MFVSFFVRNKIAPSDECPTGRDRLCEDYFAVKSLYTVMMDCSRV